MKILFAADLHFRSRWFHCLLDQGVNFDLICIAGDLLDMFKGAPRMEQAREVSRWIRELSKVTWVAVCSGNHDNAGRQISADRAPVYEWLVALGREPKIITDGATQVVNDLIVTTVPITVQKSRSPSGLIAGLPFEGNEEINGLSSTAYRREPILVPPPRKRKPQSFFELTDRSISFAGTAINFRTFREAVGRNGSTE
jgi:predicted MPP superfamily phosphohydrolase